MVLRFLMLLFAITCFYKSQIQKVLRETTLLGKVFLNVLKSLKEYIRYDYFIDGFIVSPISDYLNLVKCFCAYVTEFCNMFTKKLL